MERKLWLSFLLLHVIHDTESSPGEWNIKVPTHIPVLQGSCVVIPCSYSYPKPISKLPITRWRGFWKKGYNIVSTNLPKWKLSDEYRKRTQFVGNLRYRNCTLLLDGVRGTDAGAFYFRIEMPQYKSFSFTKNKVTIDVLRKPKPPSLSVKVEGKVTASCSVNHTCPTMPPSFSWSRTGSVRLWTKRLSTWEWQTVSTLTFKPLANDIQKLVNCTVRHRGGKLSSASVPVSRNITSHSARRINTSLDH